MRVMWKLRRFLRRYLRKYLLIAISFGAFTLGIVYLVQLAWVAYDTQHCTDLEYEDDIAEVRELFSHTFKSNTL